MELAKEIDGEKTQKKGNDKEEHCFLRGQLISDGNDQGCQVNHLSSDLNAADHFHNLQFGVLSSEFGEIRPGSLSQTHSILLPSCRAWSPIRPWRCVRLPAGRQEERTLRLMTIHLMRLHWFEVLRVFTPNSELRTHNLSVLA